MGNLSIGRSLILRQLLYIGLLVALSVVAYLASLQVRDLAHAIVSADPRTAHLEAIALDRAAGQLSRDLLFGSALGCVRVVIVATPIA